MLLTTLRDLGSPSYKVTMMRALFPEQSAIYRFIDPPDRANWDFRFGTAWVLLPITSSSK